MIEVLDLVKNVNKSGFSRDKINKVNIGLYNNIVKIYWGNEFNEDWESYDLFIFSFCLNF